MAVGLRANEEPLKTRSKRALFDRQMPSNRASIVKDFVTSDLRPIIASVYHSHQYQLDSSHVLSIHKSLTATAVTPLQLYI